MHVKANCKVKLDKYTISSDGIVTWVTEQLFYDWARDPLNMPVVTLKYPGHVDLKLSNPRIFLTAVKQQSQNACYIYKLLVTNVISPKSRFFKFSFG
jgi:hypothetical protein